MSNRTPKANSVRTVTERKPVATITENYKALPISWRIGNIDFEYEWGWKAIKGDVKFTYSDSLLEEVIESNNDEIDKKLSSLNGRSFDDLHAFMTSLHKGLSGPIPNDISRSIVKEVAYNYFWETILPKIRTVEKATWHSIESATHGGQKGKSNSHYVSIGDLPREAQKRLQEIGFIGWDQIYSLRPGGGKFRIFGFVEFNCLNITWITPDHDAWK